MDEQEERLNLRRFISVEALVQLGITLSALAFGYGTLSSRVDSLTEAVQALEQRDITPGAEKRISVLESQTAQIRVDTAEWRRDTRTQLDRIEAKIDAHAERAHR